VRLPIKAKPMIRLWKLGSKDYVPTKAAFDRFKMIVSEAVKTGTMDIIWDSNISVELVEIDKDVTNYVVGPDGKLEEIK